jgi:hypothetical protein
MTLGGAVPLGFHQLWWGSLANCSRISSHNSSLKRALIASNVQTVNEEIREDERHAHVMTRPQVDPRTISDVALSFPCSRRCAWVMHAYDAGSCLYLRLFTRQAC